MFLAYVALQNEKVMTLVQVVNGLIHTCNGVHKEMKLPFEDIQSMLQDRGEVGLACCNETKLFLNSTADGGKDKLLVCQKVNRSYSLHDKTLNYQ